MNAGLTPRELRVLQLIAEGLTERSVAKQLDITIATAHFHALNLLKKLDARNRASAVATAFRRGIIE
jgi:DNA-binding CsgD family transcriptional regulator